MALLMGSSNRSSSGFSGDCRGWGGVVMDLVAVGVSGTE